ncbi:MAG: MarR family transcriptional regulator, partial [Actinobacteria bacterium]|nr:MarR family transcriptional regulator [Actinomycetota bacterium]
MSTNAGPYLRVLHNLHRADLLSRRAADQQLGERIGIGRAMFLTLDTLARANAGGISQQAIADQLGLTKAAVSRHIAAARGRGWLSAQPSPASRRENSVALTAPGRKLVEQGRRHRAEAERQAVEVLGAEDLQHAAQTLERLCALLEKRLR